MSDKIFLNARYAFRSDTLENWQRINPVLESGEPAIVSDGTDGEWFKIGDGVKPFNSLEWKKGPKGDKGDAGQDGTIEVDQTYDPESENAQSGIAVAEALATVGSVPKNYEKIATITVSPDTDGKLPTSIIFSADTSGKAFELTDFYIKGLIGATDGSSAKANIFVNNQAVFGAYTFGSTLKADTLRSWYMQWINLGENNGALCIAPAGTMSSTKLPTLSSINFQAISGGLILPSFTQYFPIESVNITLSAGTSKTWINGSTFELWGVRK